MPDLKMLAIALIVVLILGFVGFDLYPNRQSQSSDIGPELLSELRALQQGQQESKAQKEANDVKHTSAMSVLQSELRALQQLLRARDGVAQKLVDKKQKVYVKETVDQIRADYLASVASVSGNNWRALLLLGYW